MVYCLHTFYAILFPDFSAKKAVLIKYFSAYFIEDYIRARIVYIFDNV